MDIFKMCMCVDPIFRKTEKQNLNVRLDYHLLFELEKTAEIEPAV